MKISKLAIACLLSLSLSLATSAQGSTSLNTPAGSVSGAFETTATSSDAERTYIAMGGPFVGVRFLSFRVTASQAVSVSLAVSGVVGGSPFDFSASTCNFLVGAPFGVSLRTVTRSSNSITCEVGVNLNPSEGREFQLMVGTAQTANNFGVVPIAIGGISSNNNQNQNQNQNNNQNVRPSASAPIKYSGPEFSELSLKPALSGTATTLEGRKLDQISSVTIGGKAAVLSNATDKSVNIGLPSGLAPGVYDLVVTTANHGKLTHMNAIRIREELPATSLTIQGTGVLSGEEFKKLTAFARTQNPDMSTVTCIVNSGSEGKSFTQARALCDRIAATNLNIKTTQFETRSTVKSSAVYARVVFSSVQ